MAFYSRLPLKELPTVLSFLLAYAQTTQNRIFPISPTVKLSILVIFLIINILITSGSYEITNLQRMKSQIVLISVLMLSFSINWIFNDVNQRRLYLFSIHVILIANFFLFYLRKSIRFCTILIYASTIDIVISIITQNYLLWPDGRNRLTGVNHPIFLGIESALVIIAILSDKVYKLQKPINSKLILIIFAGALFCLIMSGTRQSLFATLIAFILLIVWKDSSFKKIHTLVVLYFLTSAYLVQQIFYSKLITNEKIEKLLQINGRVEIWNEIKKSPIKDYLFGYGFGSLSDGFGNDSEIWLATQMRNPENSFLQSFLNGGLLGLAIWFLIIFIIIKFLITDKKTYHAVPLMSIIVITSFVGTGLVDGIQWWWIIALYNDEKLIVHNLK